MLYSVWNQTLYAPLCVCSRTPARFLLLVLYGTCFIYSPQLSVSVPHCVQYAVVLLTVNLWEWEKLWPRGQGYIFRLARKAVKYYKKSLEIWNYPPVNCWLWKCIYLANQRHFLIFILRYYKMQKFLDNKCWLLKN